MVLSESQHCDKTVSSASKQRAILCEYFVSSAGEVPWQYNYVQRGVYSERYKENV